MSEKGIEIVGYILAILITTAGFTLISSAVLGLVILTVGSGTITYSFVNVFVTSLTMTILSASIPLYVKSRR